MGSWKYCSNCEEGLPPASLFEDLEVGQKCPYCDAIQEREKSLEEWVLVLAERVAELEEREDKRNV